MKRVARIALVVVLLVGCMVRVGWCQKNAEQYAQELNSKTEDALKKLDLQQSAILAEHAYRYTIEYLGKKHPKTLEAENNIVGLYYYQGKNKEAKDLCEKNFRLRREILGDKHKDTLESMANLAEIYTTLGNYKESETLSINALQLRRETLGDKHPDTLESINNLARLYHIQGFYDKAESLYRNGLQLSKEILGQEHTHTIGFMGNLSELYQQQGNYKEAEALLKQSLQSSEKVFGKDHKITIDLIYKLSGVYHSQGRRDEAVELMVNAIKVDKNIREKISSKSANLLGEAIEKGNRQDGIKYLIALSEKMRNDTIKNIGYENRESIDLAETLAALYTEEGLYDKAESLLKEAIKVRENELGGEHPDLLSSMSKLANLYILQSHYGEAESLCKKILELRKKNLGRNHQDTLSSMGQLAALYRQQGRADEAIPLLNEALRISGETLGWDNPKTLELIDNLSFNELARGNFGEDTPLLTGKNTYDKIIPLYERSLRLKEKELDVDGSYSLNALAYKYQKQRKYNEAENLYKAVLQARKKHLGLNNSSTIESIGNLAYLYHLQKMYGEAKPLYKEAIELSRKILGKDHLLTIGWTNNYVVFLVMTGEPKKALSLLKDEEQGLLSHSFHELYTSSSEKTKRLYIDSIRDFQNIVFSLASEQQEAEYQRYAAEVILRWKQVYAEESGIQHRLINLYSDSAAVELKQQLAASRVKLSEAVRQPEENQSIPKLIEKLNQNETSLASLARQSRTSLNIAGVNIEQLASNLPAGTGILEYRLFRHTDFIHVNEFYEPRLAAMLVLASPENGQQIYFRVFDTLLDVNEVLEQSKKQTSKTYKRLLGPFDEQISSLKQIYIAPDGPLSLLSFASLRLPDGRFLVERQQINQLQTGRDLLADNSGVSGKGLVAVGGVDYGKADTAASEQTLAAAKPAQRAVRELFRAGIEPLPESKSEAQTIGKIFTSNVKEEAEVLLDANADEHTLKNLKQPPRILHLSTHGFYLAQDEKSKLADEAPLLLSGLALAGANNGLQGKLDQHGDDGLLYSLEVLGLNLHGTELVSLSACDTGKGVLDYSEGVYGLVRAFRTAGAKNVLMTLTPVDDKPARDFMETFYDKWLSSRNNISPAEALHQTRLQCIRDKKPTKDWAPYVLVGR